jgi:hypothetical protein
MNEQIMKTILRSVTLLVLVAAVNAQAGDEKKEKRDNRNYILRRQEAYQVRGTPEQRLIIGKREIDIYRDGSAFEKDQRVR